MAEHLKHDWQLANFDEADQSLCRWATKLTMSPSDMTKQDVENLEKYGFSHEAISDAAQVIGYFNYINRIADGLGVDLEPEMKK